MTKRTRRNHTFKAKVALAALKGDKILSDLSQQFECAMRTRSRPGGRSFWKGQPGVFGASPSEATTSPPVDAKELHAQIGQLTLENEHGS